MPQTVPNNPTNGAVEPTVARMDRPDCMRICRVPTLRTMSWLNQALTSTWPARDSYLRSASIAESTRKRNGLSLLSAVAPFCSESALEKAVRADCACAAWRRCSSSLDMITYQLSSDISTNRISVVLVTISPCPQATRRP